MRPKPAPRQRSTRQRTLILSTLEKARGFMSAQTLHFDLSRRGHKIGLATVYRNLQSLVDAEEIDALTMAGGETGYRRCASDGHHHHLVCRRCGRSVEVIGEEVEKWATKMARRHGYTDVTHTAELFGLCGSCSLSEEV